ncbi:MAG TPA: aldo/keto reductase [Chloroflexota bacterium]|jgi:L-galactose dehydrogenase|nr:aldo/keto reductase [Chloroflexota bacterium]
MQYRTLGRTGLRVSLAGLGSGGASQLGQSYGLSRADSHKIVRRALDLGVNTFDTGKYSDSESLIGEALDGVPRDSYVINTKFLPRGDDGQPTTVEGMRAQVEESLRRLRTDHVDVLMIHGVSAAVYDAAVERYMPELQKLQREGKMRFIGISEAGDDDHAMAVKAIDSGLFDAIMVNYNLLAPGAWSNVFPAAKSKNVGIFIMCAIRTVIARPELLEAVIKDWKKAGLLREDAVPDSDPLGWALTPDAPSVTSAAYKFAADSDAVGCVLTGTANLEHLEDNIAAIAGPGLPEATTQRLLDTFLPVGKNLRVRFERNEQGVMTFKGIGLFAE